jgi:hypothetical protein
MFVVQVGECTKQIPVFVFFFLGLVLYEARP